MIPPRHIRDVYSISEKRLDVHDTGNKTIQAQWTIWDKNIYNNAFHIDVIRNHITKNLGLVTPPIALELKFAFEREWGTASIIPTQSPRVEGNRAYIPSGWYNECMRLAYVAAVGTLIIWPVQLQ